MSEKVDALFVEGVSAELLDQRTTSRRKRSAPNLSEVQAISVATEIALAVEVYRDERRRESRPEVEARNRWNLSSQERVRALTAWIVAGPPCPCGRSWRLDENPADHECEFQVSDAFVEALREASVAVAQPLVNFGDWLEHELSGDVPEGRPIDWTRKHLEERVGFALHEAGVKLATGAEGVYGRVLQLVYDEIGFDKGPHAAIVSALERHPEWR